MAEPNVIEKAIHPHMEGDLDRYALFEKGFLETGGPAAAEMATRSTCAFSLYYTSLEKFPGNALELGRAAGNIFYAGTRRGYALCQEKVRRFLGSNLKNSAAAMRETLSKIEQMAK